MALRFYLGDDFSLDSAGRTFASTCELKCSTRWTAFQPPAAGDELVSTRFSNGLTVRDTLTEIADIHDRNLDLGRLDRAIVTGIERANADREKLLHWFGSRVSEEALAVWVDAPVAKSWGKKAAARCLHICQTGSDGEFVNPFAGGKPSERTLRSTCEVPGATKPATSLYDVSQALSWIASQRPNVEERLAWQTDIPKLIAELEKTVKAH